LLLRRLIALIGQESLMSGRMSALSNIFLFLPVGAAYFASGFMTEYLTPRQIFLMVLVLTTTLSVFGFWKPRSVFSHAYDNPHAKGTHFLGDVKRLLKHRAIYPVVLINLLWNFSPGSFTPMQFFLTNQLHASDAIYADFLGLYNLFYLPPVLLYGVLCTKFPPRKLLWWSVIVGVPQFIPMAFVHSGRHALLMAVLIGLMGGLANAACIDIAIRACPPGLQGTLMMMIAATFALSSPRWPGSVLAKPLLCARGHHCGFNQTKKNVMNKAVGHDFPLRGHRARSIVMHTKHDLVAPECEGAVVGSRINQFCRIHVHHDKSFSGDSYFS
jgi:hypothetical protein